MSSLTRCAYATLLVAVACASLDSQAEEQKTQEVNEPRPAEWVRSMRPPLERGASPLIRPQLDERGGRQSDPQEGGAQLWAISLQDKTLYRVMRRWAAQARYQLVWQVDRDFPIESEVVFEGGFRTAVAEAMSGVSMTDFPLQAIINTSTRVVRVVRFLEEREEVIR